MTPAIPGAENSHRKKQKSVIGTYQVAWNDESKWFESHPRQTFKIMARIGWNCRFRDGLERGQSRAFIAAANVESVAKLYEQERECV